MSAKLVLGLVAIAFLVWAKRKHDSAVDGTDQIVPPPDSPMYSQE